MPASLHSTVTVAPRGAHTEPSATTWLTILGTSGIQLGGHTRCIVRPAIQPASTAAAHFCAVVNPPGLTATCQAHAQRCLEAQKGQQQQQP